MSYRSVKRVLGETSLERKCRFLFGACLLLLIIGSFLWYGRVTEQLVWIQNREKARLLADAIPLKVHWPALETNEKFKTEVVAKLVKKLGTPDAPDGTIKLVNEKDRTVTIDQGQADDLKVGTVFAVYDETADVAAADSSTRKGQIEVVKILEPHRAEARIVEQRPGNPILVNDKILSPVFRYRWEALRPVANRREDKGRPKNQFEEKLLKKFDRAAVEAAAGTAEASDVSELEGLAIAAGAKDDSHLFAEQIDSEKQEYHYYRPIYVGSGCVDCHRIHTGNTTLAENDLLSIIHVRLPTSDTYKAIRTNRAMLLTNAIITVFLAMIALYAIVRYVIVKPLKHLRDVSDEISRGNIALRANIHTSDEFEELGTAFNRMLQKILDASQELRHLNENLDAKVDELAQANMRLFEMNRLKSDFLATMSHELRTPLNSIIGFSDVLNSIDSLDGKQRRYVQNIQKSGRVLLEMINDILDLAKIESGKMELNLTRFRIEPVITAQCDMARPLAEKKNVDLTTHIEAGLPELYQDQSKLQQIVNNLLSNAIKFTPEGGRVEVTAQAAPRDRLELIVSDTGVGIAEADQTLIFEKFRQGRTVMAGGDAMTREYSGTGLGLSIVKELCKLLGGEITLVSQLGKGSIFTIRIPMSREEQPRLESPLATELDELANPRPELPRFREQPIPIEPQVVE